MHFSNQNWIKYSLFISLIAGFFFIDRIIKNAVLEGFLYDGQCISFVHAMNEGVAFSWFAALGEHLKWMQVALLLGIFLYLYFTKYIKHYPIPIALLFAGGLGNIYDRFVHGAVIDFIYWHCGFDFAIFNFADIIINVGVFTLLLVILIEERQKKDLK